MKQTKRKPQPLDRIEWIERSELRSNDYNPNHVARPELALLKLSILADGWTQPIVARSTGEIVDGFHRRSLAADPEIAALTDGLVPVVRLSDELPMSHQIASTIRHNRARGTHGINPMTEIIRSLLDTHQISSEELQKTLGMDKEEVERLADTSGMPDYGSEAEFNKGWKPV